MTSSSDSILYQESQPYRTSPPYILIIGVMIAAGLGLVLWSIVLDRPLGSLSLPDAAVWAIGLALGIVFPLILLRARLTVQVHKDRVVVRTGLAGTHSFAFNDVEGVVARMEGASGIYKNSSLANEARSRTAFTVTSLKGTELIMRDGRLILIGSQTPEQLTAAVTAAWEPAYGPTSLSQI